MIMIRTSSGYSQKRSKLLAHIMLHIERNKIPHHASSQTNQTTTFLKFHLKVSRLKGKSHSPAFLTKEEKLESRNRSIKSVNLDRRKRVRGGPTKREAMARGRYRQKGSQGGRRREAREWGWGRRARLQGGRVIEAKENEMSYFCYWDLGILE